MFSMKKLIILVILVEVRGTAAKNYDLDDLNKDFFLMILQYITGSHHKFAIYMKVNVIKIIL